jgi:hypothetical protein
MKTDYIISRIEGSQDGSRYVRVNDKLKNRTTVEFIVRIIR